MSFNVRIFGHNGTRQIAQVNPGQFTSEIVQVLQQPYNWSQTLATNGATAVNSAAVANDTSKVIRIEIPDGMTIRYEINNGARAGGVVQAGNNSPRLSGVDIFDWGTGWTVSVVEASFFL